MDSLLQSCWTGPVRVRPDMQNHINSACMLVLGDSRVSTVALCMELWHDLPTPKCEADDTSQSLH